MIDGRFRLVLTGGAGAAVLAVGGVTGCTIGGEGKLASGNAADAVTITPANGTAQVRPDGTIEVKTSGGKLQNVTVQGQGATITGAFDGGRRKWRSTRTLTPGTSYTVTAQARDDGKTRTVTSSFTTLKADKTLSIVDVTPNVKGEKVGIGMPIIVRFDRPVSDKAAVERSLRVTPDKPVEGAWRWVSADQVVYRTKTYWQPHQTVRFHASLAGVNAGGGVYGAEDEQATLTIGAAQITTGAIDGHHMTVTRDGKKLRTVPFSAGNGQTREYTTTSGVHLLMEKGNPVTMTSPGRKPGDPGYYKQVVNYAVRFSNSGEYVHSAPWSVGSQGSANVSHGCLNVSPANAKWFYDIMQRGDVIKLTGTDRQVEPDNGWGFWQLSYDEWRQGSALR
ncbi:lipoprotein-anchoring transpeptidase ErfK/SrfK [Actinomadura pelletieri DSM 43383]|uniref:Lipoprotein-anchoring transpeptidase ErfK/SrfK n=1 Tax=Actinomadura pelletieri DSM 43383 TaxID=1120940 RepID=A0A495Q9E4_9ACTN|nr:Ig-like domain-containing protein [Actinomadura pelletieri]RKS67744.1 lipoprotein-anchoring transpeptidase ErfK/SrfK [Actinomadura pelletieri DSM 43383]